MLLADQGQYTRAVDAFKRLLANEPKHANGWALLGLSEYELGRYDDAYRHIQHGRTLEIGNTELRNVATFHSALIMIQKGEFEVAHHLLVEVAHTPIGDPDLATAFGLAALRVASTPEKLPELADAQRNPVTRVGEIELQATHAPLEDTVAAYRKLVQEMPDAPKLHYAFGNFLITAGHYDEGIREMQKELALNPNDAMALLQIAMADVKTGRFEQAASYAEKAVQLAPKLFVSHYALGWAQFKLGQIDRAVPELEKAVTLAPDSPQCHYALSQAYGRAHRKEDSDHELRTFARLKQTQAEQTQAAAETGLSRPKLEEIPSHPEPR